MTTKLPEQSWAAFSLRHGGKFPIPRTLWETAWTEALEKACRIMDKDPKAKDSRIEAFEFMVVIFNDLSDECIRGLMEHGAADGSER